MSAALNSYDDAQEIIHKVLKLPVPIQDFVEGLNSTRFDIQHILRSLAERMRLMLDNNEIVVHLKPINKMVDMKSISIVEEAFQFFTECSTTSSLLPSWSFKPETNKKFWDKFGQSFIGSQRLSQRELDRFEELVSGHQFTVMKIKEINVLQIREVLTYMILREYVEDKNVEVEEQIEDWERVEVMGEIKGGLGAGEGFDEMPGTAKLTPRDRDVAAEGSGSADKEGGAGLDGERFYSVQKGSGRGGGDGVVKDVVVPSGFKDGDKGVGGNGVEEGDMGSLKDQEQELNEELEKSSARMEGQSIISESANKYINDPKGEFFCEQFCFFVSFLSFLLHLFSSPLELLVL